MNTACDSSILANPGKTLTIYRIPRIIVRIALPASVTPHSITSGFYCIGIVPFNRYIFNDSDFAPAQVTDRPLAMEPVSSTSTAATRKPIPSTSVASVKNPGASRPTSTANASEPVPSTSLVNARGPVPGPSVANITEPRHCRPTSESGEQGMVMSPEHARPFPKAPPRNTCAKKGGSKDENQPY